MNKGKSYESPRKYANIFKKDKDSKINQPTYRE